MQCPWPGLEPRPLESETSALTMKHLAPHFSKLHNLAHLWSPWRGGGGWLWYNIIADRPIKIVVSAPVQITDEKIQIWNFSLTWQILLRICRKSKSSKDVPRDKRLLRDSACCRSLGRKRFQGKAIFRWECLKRLSWIGWRILNGTIKMGVIGVTPMLLSVVVTSPDKI